MIDIKIKYQASIFLTSIETTPANISSLMQAFLDRGLMPTTYQEITSSSPISQLRFNLNSLNNEWIIAFREGRIDIEKNQIDLRGSNLGEIQNFCGDVIQMYSKILTLFPRKAHRLALSGNCILREMSNVELDQIYLKIFNPTQTYLTNLPIEWNSRAVARVKQNVNEKEEILNYIAEVNRVLGQMNNNQSIIPIDRIAINLDINTIPDNREGRFAIEDIANFYGNVSQWYVDLCNELLEKIRL